MKMKYQIRAKDSRVDCVFDFSEYKDYPLTITNVAGVEKADIKRMFMETMDNLFEHAWDCQDN